MANEEILHSIPSGKTAFIYSLPFKKQEGEEEVGIVRGNLYSSDEQISLGPSQRGTELGKESLASSGLSAAGPCVPPAWKSSSVEEKQQA